MGTQWPLHLRCLRHPRAEMPPDVGGIFQKKTPNQQVMLLALLLETWLGQARDELGGKSVADW